MSTSSVNAPDSFTPSQMTRYPISLANILLTSLQPRRMAQMARMMCATTLDRSSSVAPYTHVAVTGERVREKTTLSTSIYQCGEQYVRTHVRTHVPCTSTHCLSSSTAVHTMQYGQTKSHQSSQLVHSTTGTQAVRYVYE